ncbi:MULTISPECIES: phosphatidylserine decarboxylase [Bacillus]|uniref:phosphatidylserine decarboxylase n=1 Tax=Bacillus glycinifermentans TaxID=1664069 RepID=A0A0T6BRA1_9BACI|nr:MULTISPECIES: phosphatidylserine decarboxylase [Bacillus]ATH92966.1 phosphatidylserine decarboxylase [Bacillus glycinifermentans]KKB72868.1 phosphatidylserine decarboxylase [Bacillus sp. TH008]KRT94181.1 phosphatidylserine decarboxylase [Bacillus glycinifermentans]MDU0072750.1 phosphatidylserine decarboxylase [Bacillus sp. IG6]MEC0486335.1 phosphatidylserine decarboxylase [Bacillus glycinifermentans]
MKKRLYRCLIELTNKKGVSRALKKFAQSKLSKPLIRPYMKTFQINTEEMLEDVSSFNSLHELFIRRLKDGARPIPSVPDCLISPVDGVIEEMGTVSADKQFIVKHKPYSLEEMIGNDAIANRYLGGTYIIIYLSPRDYHRIHSPADGTLETQYSLGSSSYPVNKTGLTYGKSPLTKNYRMISEIRHQYGSALLVKVGAMYINSIVMLQEAKNWRQGEEIAYFSFGSTVILLFEKDTFIPVGTLCPSLKVKMGDILGSLASVK